MLSKKEILAQNPDLLSYQVTLLQEEGDAEPIAFDCYAQNDDHAKEQALDAYPEGRVTQVTANAGNETDVAPEIQLPPHPN